METKGLLLHLQELPPVPILAQNNAVNVPILRLKYSF